MLEAATAVFAEQGYDSATVEVIAARAETSVGSVYQFFPNKKALFEAVWAQYLDETRALFETVLAQSIARGIADWRTLLDESIDAFWDLDRTSKAFRAVWLNGQHSVEFLADGYALNQQIATRLSPLLRLLVPSLKVSQRKIVASVLVESMSSMLFFAVRCEAKIARKIVGECKLMLRRYLEVYVVDPGDFAADRA